MARPRTRPPGKYIAQGQQLAALIAAQPQPYTLVALAERTGVSFQMLSKLTTGETLPSTRTKEALIAILGSASIEAIDWPRAKSPLTKKAALSKATPPGSLGAELKTLRLSLLPDPPSQKELAERLGLTWRAYRHLETGGGRRLKAEILGKLFEVYGEKLWDVLRKDGSPALPSPSPSHPPQSVSHQRSS